MQTTQQDAPQMQWSSRSVGSELQHRIFYYLIRIGGWRMAYFLLYPVVFYYALLSRSAREKASFYLKRRFKMQKPADRFLHTYRLLLNLGKVLIDRALVGILGPGRLNVTLQGRAELLQPLRENRGLVLMMSHVGCWQVAMSALGFMETPVNLLLQREAGDVDRHFFEHSGTNCPFRTIDPRGYLGGVMEMMGVLKNGEILSVMGDRVLGSDKNVVTVDFLGDPVAFPYSAYKIASNTAAPVVVLFTAKTGADSYRLFVADIIDVPPGLGRRPEHYRPYVNRFTRALEAYTRDYPYQFFNFYNLWDTEP